MPRIAIVSAAFLSLFLACVAAGTILFGPAVEKDLVKRAMEILKKVDEVSLRDAIVTADGRNLTVAGHVRRKAHLSLAEEGLAEMKGAGKVKSELVWVPLEPWLRIARGKEGSLVVDGLLESRAEKARLGVAAREVNDGVNIQMKAEADADVAKADWLEPLGRVLEETFRIDKVVSLTVRDGKVLISGEVYSDTSMDEAEKIVAGVFDDGAFEIENRLEVVPPPLAPWIVLKKESPEKFLARGTLRSEQRKHELIGIAASELKKGAKITNRVETGDNVASAAWWSEAVLVLPAVLAEMQPCEVEIRNGVLRLAGDVASEPMRESITSLLEQNFPDESWSRSVKIAVVEPPVPSRLSVIVFSGDQIFLKGVLPSAEVKKAVLAKAGEKVPGKEIVDQIETRKNAMDPKWLEAFSEFLPGYSENALRGGMTIDDDQLVIEARVDSDAKWDALFALAEKHFPMSEFRHRIDLRVIDPSAPDPEDPLGPADPDAFNEGG